MIGPILSCLSKDERTTCQHLDIAILLVEDCKDLNVKDDMGKSPSNYASMSGHFKIVDLIAKRTSSGPLRGTFGLILIQTLYSSVGVRSLLRLLAQISVKVGSRNRKLLSYSNNSPLKARDYNVITTLKMYCLLIYDY